LRVILGNDHADAAWTVLGKAVWVLSEDVRLLAAVLRATALDALVGVVLALASLPLLLGDAAGVAVDALLVQALAAALGHGPGVHLLCLGSVLGCKITSWVSITY
jgi:hypothetical protein